MIKEIKYNGFSASPGDHEALEGDLCVAMNLIPEHNAMCSGGTVARSSAGASELMPVFVSDSAGAVDAAGKRGLFVVCADERGEPVGECLVAVPLCGADDAAGLY